MCVFFGFVDSCNDNGLVMFLCGTVVLVVMMMMGTEIALRRGAKIKAAEKVEEFGATYFVARYYRCCFRCLANSLP